MVAADREQRIREMAHELWEREGGGHGEQDRHWLEAERRVDEADRMSASPRTVGPLETAAPKAGARAAKKATAAPTAGTAGGRRRPTAGANGLAAR